MRIPAAIAGRRETYRTGRVLTALVVVCALSVGAAPATAPPAEASVLEYCTSTYTPGRDCYGPRHSLVRAESWHYWGEVDYLEAVSALDANLNPYGHWAFGYQIACHSYGGSNLLYPWLYNPDSRGQAIRGLMYYGSGESQC